MFYTLIICVITLVIIFYMYRKKMKSKYPEPPSYPGALPFIGHAYIMLGDTIDNWETVQLISNYSLKVGGVLKTYAGSNNFYVISDPDDFLTVTNTYLDKATLYNIAKQHLGNGLVTSDVSLWKKHRKILIPAFAQRMLIQFLDNFNSQSRKYVEQLASEVDKGKFDQYKYLLDNQLELGNQTILGLKNEDKNLVYKNYPHDIDTIFEMFGERFKSLWLYLPLLYNRSNMKKKYDYITNNMKTLFLTAIEKRQIEIQGNNKENHIPKGSILLDYFLEKMEDNDDISHDDIQAHLETFTIGTFDANSATLTYAMKLIGTHPKVQEQLIKEIHEIFGQSNRDVGKDDLPKLKYMEAVLKETMRLYPVVPLIARTAQQDVKLKNYTIPGGHSLVCSIHGVHRHPVWGSDVECFKPERWLDSKGPSEGLFVGFSKGKRNCIGEQYAWIGMKIMLVHILRRYSISADNDKLVLKYNVMVKPVSGYYISIKLRS